MDCSRRTKGHVVLFGVACCFTIFLWYSSHKRIMGNRGFVIPPPDHVLNTLKRDGKGENPTLGTGKRVSVLVWNVHKGHTRGFAAAFEGLVKGRDLVLLQEVLIDQGKEGNLDTYLADSDIGYAMATAFTYRAGGSQAGVAIGSTSAPTSVEAQVTPDLEPVVSTPKSSLIAEYNLPCDATPAADAPTLLAASVHGINRASVEAFERQLDRLVERLARHEGPMLLAGDFNTQSARKLAGKSLLRLGSGG
jgi:endonuclease/exonuclease/phosphatase (EEP) superfamily protein YafD